MVDERSGKGVPPDYKGAHFTDWNDFRPLLKTTHEQDVGTLAIKSVAQGTWPSPDRDSRPYNTWYEPFDQLAEIEKSLQYTLSQDITAAVLPGDLKLWPMIIDAARRFEPLDTECQSEFISNAE